MKISIFWTWYVGLVTWACLAEVWHEVMCIDIDERKIENLKQWIIPIYEPGLEEIVLRNYKNWNLHFSTSKTEWIKFAKVIFSAVWTPELPNGKADLRFVESVAETFGQEIDEFKILINKSTVPVWTWDKTAEIIKKNLKDSKTTFEVVSNPEFLREWNAVWDFLNPDRIVIWCESDEAKKLMEQVYKPFESKTRILFTDIKSAEIIKYAANSFLATKLSFINEIANFASLAGWDIKEIAEWIGLDPRINNKFLNAGIGYGWSCFPKDVSALIETGKEFGYEFKIIKATNEVNEKQKIIVINKLLEEIPRLVWKKITIWGLAFKPNTDDIRDAPSLDIIRKLEDLWVSEIKLYDPLSNEHVKEKFKYMNNLTFAKNKIEALEGSDALILLTEWDEFKNIDYTVFEKLNDKVIVDWRNIWNKKEIQNLGFTYKWI